MALEFYFFRVHPDGFPSASRALLRLPPRDSLLYLSVHVAILILCQNSVCRSPFILFLKKIYLLIVESEHELGEGQRESTLK